MDEEFRRGVIRPFEVFREGWNIIEDRYWLFMGISLVGMLIGGAAPLGILWGPMICGIDLCLLRRMRGQEVTFSNLFDGFNYFKESLFVTLILVGAAMVVMLPIYLLFFATMILGAHGGGNDVAAGLIVVLLGGVFLVAMVLMTSVNVLALFAYPLIVERGMTAVEALRTSIRAVLGNLRGIIPVMLLSSLLGIAGACLCYVGVFFVMPWTFAVMIAAYSRVFPQPDSPPVRQGVI